jgi:hypothetical protein
MRMKVITGLAVAAFLTGCGGANDHPEELKGEWSTGCQGRTIESYTFDTGLTLKAESYANSNCANKRTTVDFKLSALYDPELQVTNSGTEALKAEVTLDDITFTPHDSFSLQSYKNTCPSLNWVVNQATSIMTCNHASATYLIASFNPNLPMLFYINGNDLHTNTPSSPQDANGLPLDVDYNKAYAKQ